MSSAANPRDWIAKAQQDLRSARRLLAEPAEPEDAAYHVQQAVEKAIKALLVARGVQYPRGRGAGHDLGVLAGLVPDESIRLVAERLADLTPWATVFRYPADDPFTAPVTPSTADLIRRLDQVEEFVQRIAALLDE